MPKTFLLFVEKSSKRERTVKVAKSEFLLAKGRVPFWQKKPFFWVVYSLLAITFAIIQLGILIITLIFFTG